MLPGHHPQSTFCPTQPRWQSHLLVFPQRSNTFVSCSLSTPDLTLCFTEKLGIFSRNFLGFIICLLASVANAFSPSLLVSRVSPSASSLDYCSSKSGPWSSSSDITWKLLSHTESQAPSFHQITLIQSLMTPMLPNSVLNSQSSCFSTNQQYFTIGESLLFKVFCSLAYQFFFLVLFQCRAGFSMSFTGVFSFSSLLTLSALDTVLCHVFHIHSFFRSDLIQSLDLSCHVLTTPRCISPAQMSILNSVMSWCSCT